MAKDSQTPKKSTKSSTKPLTRAETILHPVRARIIVAFSDRALTPLEIVKQMPEIPRGTIYRHINLLLEAGLIEVVAERKTYGVIERQFALVEDQAYVKREDLTADDITGLVATLTGVVQSTFGRYVQQATMPPEEGEVSFVAKPLYLTREETQALRQMIADYLKKTGRHASAEYERRLIAFFSVPYRETQNKEEETK